MSKDTRFPENLCLCVISFITFAKKLGLFLSSRGQAQLLLELSSKPFQFLLFLPSFQNIYIIKKILSSTNLSKTSPKPSPPPHPLKQAYRKQGHLGSKSSISNCRATKGLKTRSVQGHQVSRKSVPLCDLVHHFC